MATVQTKKPIEVVSWAPTATWIFKTPSTDCSICREALVKPCTQCTSGHVKGDLNCDVSRGNCGHCFHKHCIDKWTSTATNCPICSVPINITVKNMNNGEDWKQLFSAKK